MKKESLFPPEVKFPKNLAPSKLSHAVKTSGARDTIHVWGQVSSDEHGEVVGVGDLEAQIHQVFKNLEKVLMSARGTPQDVVLLNAFMKGISRIDVFRALRRQYIDQEIPPAITTVGVTGLALPDLLIEIAAFAEISPRKRAKRASRRRRRTG